MNDATAATSERLILPDIWNKSAYAAYLQLQAEKNTQDTLIFKLPYHKQMLGNPLLQVFHGGVITAFAESSAQLWWSMSQSEQQLPPIITTTMDFLRPASNKPGFLIAEPRLVRAGRRMSTVDVEVYCAEKIVSTGRIILRMA